MNASNLMAVSTADGISAGAGAPKGRTETAGNRAQTASGKNSFSDTFGALQKGMGADASKTEMREAPVKTAQTKVPQTGSTVPSPNTQDVTAEMPKMVDQKTEIDAKKTLSVDDPTADASAVAALAALVNTDRTSVDVNVNEGLDAALTEILERYDLTAEQLSDKKLQTAVQNLLQQMPEEGVKSRNLLLALEGNPPTQSVSAEDLTTVQESVSAVSRTSLQSAPTSSQAPRLAALDAVPPAQLRAALAASVAPTEVQMPSVDAATEDAVAPLPEQSSAMDDLIPRNPTLSGAPARFEEMVASVEMQQPPVKSMAADIVAAPLLRAQAETASAAAQGKSAVDLVGENLIGEETAANPLTVLAQRTMRHDTMQGDTTGQQSSAQEEQSLASGQQDVRMASDTVFEIPTRLAETMPQPAQPIAAQTGANPLPMQDVNAPVQTQEAQRPQPDYEIPRQIVEQARLLRTLTDTQMVIRLKPEHLGELTLRVAVGSDGAVQASFHSDNAHVRNVIENSLVQLRQELTNQGIKVDRVGVYAGLTDGQMPQGQGQEAWQQQSSHRSETQRYTRGDADDYLDEIDGLAPITAEEMGGSVGADGVDYRV